MPEFPVELRYTLSRSQRLVPLLRMWGTGGALYVTALFAFFVVQTIVSAWTLRIAGVAVFGGLALLVSLLFRRLIIGLVDVVLVPRRHMDITLEENAAGILFGSERWYMFFDSIRELRKYRDDVWTIEHVHGTVVHIPAPALGEDQVAHIRAAMARGRTPEGLRAIVERGRLIEQILRAEREGQ